MRRSLEGRNALMTGTNQGFGLAIARAYVEAGASVLMCARDAAIEINLFGSILMCRTLLPHFKAHVCRRTQDLAPRVHNLVRLAELAGAVERRRVRRRHGAAEL